MPSAVWKPERDIVIHLSIISHSLNLLLVPLLPLALLAVLLLYWWFIYTHPLVIHNKCYDPINVSKDCIVIHFRLKNKTSLVSLGLFRVILFFLFLFFSFLFLSSPWMLQSFSHLLLKVSFKINNEDAPSALKRLLIYLRGDMKGI